MFFILTQRAIDRDAVNGRYSTAIVKAFAALEGGKPLERCAAQASVIVGCQGGFADKIRGQDIWVTPHPEALAPLEPSPARYRIVLTRD